MKRNNVAKHIGIASLCLATAISAFSGISSFKNDSIVLAEEATTSVWGDFITTSEGATVSTDDSNRLNVSSATPYEATFNQIFYGNIELRFVFPERYETALANVWGDFKFRITNAADDTNFFDIVYKKVSNGTAMYVEWNGHTIQCANAATTYDYASSDYIYDDEIDGRAAYVSSPSFMGVSSTRGTRTGRLTLKWGAAGNTDQLWVTTNGPQKSSDKYSVIVAKFDGSYDGSLDSKGFVEKSKWGLPKMTFPNGYKISFSSDTGAKDATDVCFTSIVNNGTTASKAVVSGGKTTNSFTESNFAENNYTKAYDLMEANAGKALLGWKDAEGALYPTKTALKSADIGAYTPVFLGFERIYGASVRIDTVYGNSGLRFITGFTTTKEELQALIDAGYVQSFGTLLAYTDSLTEGIFDVVNYADALAVETGKKVTQQESSKKMFAYTAPVRDNAGNILTDDNGAVITKDYTAYSVALVNPNIQYAQSFSARGYIEVAYADGTTAILYTAFNETNNSRSIEQTAYNLMTSGKAEYDTYNEVQQGIVKKYAAALLPAEE